MKYRCMLSAVLLAWLATPLLAAATPLDADLPEGELTLITCPYKDPPRLADQPEPIQIAEEGEYHYRVYIPKGYHADPKRRYPCMFVASPGGNARIGNLQFLADREEWLFVLLVEAKDGPWGPIWGSFLAAHDDAEKRLRLLPNWKFGSGMSGGARFVSAFAELRPGFRGAILQAAGIGSEGAFGYYFYMDGPAKQGKTMILYGTFGHRDKNLQESIQMRVHARDHVIRNVEVYEGDHNWAPVVVARHAMDWIEAQIFLVQPAQRADADMARLYYKRQRARYEKADSDFARLEQLEILCNLVKRYQPRDNDEVKKKLATWTETMAALEKKPDVQRELKAREAYRRVAAKEMPAGKWPRKGVGAKGKLTAKDYARYKRMMKRLAQMQGGDTPPVISRKDARFTETFKKLYDAFWPAFEAKKKDLARFAKEYEAVSRNNADTVYGKRAAARGKAVALESQAQRRR